MDLPIDLESPLLKDVVVESQGQALNFWGKGTNGEESAVVCLHGFGPEDKQLWIQVRNSAGEAAATTMTIKQMRALGRAAFLAAQILERARKDNGG